MSVAIWSARVCRRVGVSETSSSRPVVKMPMVVEPRQEDGLDPGQFVDRWHVRMMPCGDAPSWAYHGAAKVDSNRRPQDRRRDARQGQARRP